MAPLQLVSPQVWCICFLMLPVTGGARPLYSGPYSNGPSTAGGYGGLRPPTATASAVQQRAPPSTAGLTQPGSQSAGPPGSFSGAPAGPAGQRGPVPGGPAAAYGPSPVVPRPSAAGYGGAPSAGYGGPRPSGFGQPQPGGYQGTAQGLAPRPGLVSPVSVSSPGVPLHPLRCLGLPCLIARAGVNPEQPDGPGSLPNQEHHSIHNLYSLVEHGDRLISTCCVCEQALLHWLHACRCSQYTADSFPCAGTEWFCASAAASGLRLCASSSGPRAANEPRRRLRRAAAQWVRTAPDRRAACLWGRGTGRGSTVWRAAACTWHGRLRT